MKRNDNHLATMAMPTSRRRSHMPEAGANSRPVEVELTCEAPQAETVFVAGDFNQWRADDLRLRQDETGTWKVQVWLAPGRHEYRFIVDGEWKDDPHASARVPNAFGSNNCVLQVPPLEVNA
jgi:1,4-alpha-glucan branching enzyme